MTHIMIDIETLSVSRNAKILTIAAKVFDFSFKMFKGFYVKIDLDSYKENYNFHTDPKTVEWWNQQSENIKNEAFFGENRIAIEKAMKLLNDFIIVQPKPYYVWSHGKDFDLPILENAFET